MRADDITAAVQGATKTWAKTRRAEERRSRSAASRQYVYSDRINFTDVANTILPNAYEHASGGGRYSVSKRQFFYACREHFCHWAGRRLEYSYFAQTLLGQYMNRHAGTTARWKITADPRGTLNLPHAVGGKVPCGTLEIEDHRREAARKFEPLELDDASLRTDWPSLAVGQRYQGVLYIEKEGFAPILRESRIAERYDIATLSCKGTF